ncbi:MAG: hypothetical protein WC472_00455 [Candidatus Paceibacterota bacterium]
MLILCLPLRGARKADDEAIHPFVTLAKAGNPVQCHSCESRDLIRCFFLKFNIISNQYLPISLAINGEIGKY